jgi:excinuclease ABC subunit B
MSIFNLKSDYSPTGDQPEAIEKIFKNLKSGLRDQVLLGVTGSGKTFTIANIIEKLQKPTLIISHNKTLAGQLFQEFREFFPQNAAHYFVSYYDYYQPEAYMPVTDTYIDKDAKINDEIDKLRHASTQSIMTRKDVVVVASVSCIYGLGSPQNYGDVVLVLKKDETISQKEVIRALTDLQYERTRISGERGRFRVLGDVLYIYPVSANETYKIEWEKTKIVSIEIEPHEFKRDEFSGYLLGTNERVKKDILKVFPAKHFVAPHDKLNLVMANIRAELSERIKYFKQKNRFLEAQRIEERTNHDLEMIEMTGYCHGIENYSRQLDFREKGQPPATLVDYFNFAYGKDGWLLVIDESHMTIPQIGGMYMGDQARKKVLIKHGFRLPSATDNRPLNFKEFETRIPNTIYVSATPGYYETSKATHGNHSHINYSGKKTAGDYLNISGIVEQLIRPTGLLDPKIEIRPIDPKYVTYKHNKKDNQIQDLLKELKKEIKKGGKILVTTLTKRLAEDITDFLKNDGFRVCYLHSEVDTFDRTDVLKSLRQGKIDIIVGINLLREGLDLPEVTLVAVLDADKEGFLRNETSLIQTMGRAARHPDGRVILYADVITGSIKRAISETNRRRKIQQDYNERHDIEPIQIRKAIREDIINRKKKETDTALPPETKNKQEIIEYFKKEMRRASENYDFDKAAKFRDKYKELEKND